MMGLAQGLGAQRRYRCMRSVGYRLIVSFLLVGACGPHEDITPQIPVAPGAAQRAMWILSYARREGRGLRIDAGAAPVVAQEDAELTSPDAGGAASGGDDAIGVDADDDARRSGH